MHAHTRTHKYHTNYTPHTQGELSTHYFLSQPIPFSIKMRSLKELLTFGLKVESNKERHWLPSPGVCSPAQMYTVLHTYTYPYGPSTYAHMYTHKEVGTF